VRRSEVSGAGGITLAVTERGPADGVVDAPVVLLVHGYPDTQAVWGPVAERLAARHRVVTYDVRGAGASGAAERTAGYDLAHLVADQHLVVDAVSPGRAVHVVGHDWGSVQTWAAVAGPEAPARYAGFTSISGPSLDHMAAWVRRHRHLRAADLRALLRQARRSWYVAAFHLPGAPRAWGPLAPRWGRLLERREGVPTDGAWPAPTLRADGAEGIRLYRANVGRRLARPRPATVEVPVLVIVPERDPFLGPELVEGLEELAPDLRTRPVDAGHWVVRTHPDEVAAWVAEHVAACSPRPTPAER
jgi:pimeloyl-ACP methyl ester carboxylesterase